MTLEKKHKDLVEIRKLILELAFSKKDGHIGSSFSITEILYVYWKFFSKSNHFVLSKGHAAIGIYSVLYKLKIISKKDFFSFCEFNSKLGGHPDGNKIKDLNFSTGSLGHGLPMSVGFALSQHLKKKKSKIFCLLGDQELLEGTTWESLHLIDYLKIPNMIIIIDKNNSDFRSVTIRNLKNKFNYFNNIDVSEVDGHNISSLHKLFKNLSQISKSQIIVCKTIKGFGIKEMHNNPEWHHKTPTSKEHLHELIRKIDIR